MLFVKKEILYHIRNAVTTRHIEQGFILGSQTRFNQLDYCKEIPAIQASLNYYMPNSKIANITIQQWAKEEICFSGFLHTHIGDKCDFSDADIDFAKKLYGSYHLPLLWFGLAVVNKCDISIDFYSIQENDGDIRIIPVSYRLV